MLGRHLAICEPPQTAQLVFSTRGFPMRRSLVSIIATDDRDDRLLGELQHTWAALADVKIRHEVERKQIAAWSGLATDKERRVGECDRRYQLAREPFHHHLDELLRQVRLRARAGL
jgi:hypothetical protein